MFKIKKDIFQTKYILSIILIIALFIEYVEIDDYTYTIIELTKNEFHFYFLYIGLFLLLNAYMINYINLIKSSNKSNLYQSYKKKLIFSLLLPLLVLFYTEDTIILYFYVVIIYIYIISDILYKFKININLMIIIRLSILFICIGIYIISKQYINHELLFGIYLFIISLLMLILFEIFIYPIQKKLINKNKKRA